MSFIEHQYHQIRVFYKQNLRLLFAVTFLLFIIVIVISSIVIGLNPGLATRLLVQSSGAINATVNSAGLFPTIVENAFSSLLLVISGVVPFLFIPVLFVIYNGLIIGILFGSTAISVVTPGLIYASILPHGIFLIPAMLLAATYGAYLCKYLICRVLHKEQIVPLHTIAIEMGRAYIFIILPLMILSSIVQMFITPLIVSLL